MNKAIIKKCGHGSKAFYLVTLFQNKTPNETVKFFSYMNALFFARTWRKTV